MVDAAFLVDLRVAVEAGGDLLLERGVRQQVAGELFDRKTVERQVAVEGVDHPIAILPDLPRGVDAVAVGVGIASQVEPVAAPAFAIVGRGQQAIDQTLVGIRGLVINKGVDLGGRGRQAQQVEAEAADQRDAISFGGRLQMSSLPDGPG